MPEGDSVHRLARRMAGLQGRLITASDFRVPHLATASLTGRRIERVWAWGKNLFWDCTLEGTDTLVLHTHLRMEGHWRIHPAGTAWRGPGHTARVIMRVEGAPDPTQEVELVGHELGMVKLWPASQYPQRTAHLGPDPLADDWDSPGRWQPSGRDESVARLEADGARTIGEAVIDQRILAGVGNEYRNELCFLLGVHPGSPATCVDPARPVDLAAHLMQTNRDGPLRVFTGVNRRGHNTWVFGRNRRPCRQCGSPIQKGTLGGALSVADHQAGQERIIWWCPTCQPVDATVASSFPSGGQ